MIYVPTAGLSTDGARESLAIGLYELSKWVEDPDYREEIVLRNSNGEIIKTIQGGIFISPTGETWILN